MARLAWPASETLLIKQQNRAGVPPLRPGEPESITWTVDDTRPVC